jgi:hypothetical protein
MRRFSLLVAALCLLAACGPRDTRDDLAKLTDFHRRMIALDHDVAAASTLYTRESGAALDRGDKPALAAAARHFSATLSAILPRAQALSIPDLANQGAEDSAGRAAAALVAAIRTRRDAADAVRAMVDPVHPQPDEIAAVAAAHEASNSADVAESSSVVAAYDALGIRPDRIDFGKGGVKP